MNIVNRRTTLTLTALVFLWLGVVLPAGKAVGQQAGSTLKNQLVGTWMLVSNYTDREDGSKFDTFRLNPAGILMLDGDGRLSLQEMRSDLPKFASNNRQEGTAEENKACSSLYRRPHIIFIVVWREIGLAVVRDYLQSNSLTAQV